MLLAAMRTRRPSPLWLTLAALLLVACGKDDSGGAATTAAAKSPPAKPAAATPAPKPAATAAAKLPDIMTPDQAINQWKADKSSMMGKKVKIKGYYFNYTKQGDQLNVDVTPQPDAASKGTLCIFPGSAQGALDKVKQKSEITVSGTVDGEFFGRPKLKDCKLE